jgi:hypothetical protein
MLDRQGFFQIGDAEAGKDHQRDDLLNGLQLGGGIDRVTDAVRGNRQPIFEKCDAQLTSTTVRSGALL